MIPKTIHYCWFGGNPKPELIQKCIASWKEVLPEYDIVEWNEQNFDISSNPFTKAAYQSKKWAFVSDLARLSIIYDYGGIYMDTDVELSSEPFSEYLSCNAFFYFSNLQYIATGLGFGAKAKDPLVKKLLESYKNIEFDPQKTNELACPLLNTPVIKEMIPNLVQNNSTQLIDNYAFISENEYWKFAKHYGAFSWRSEEQDKALEYARKNHTASKFRQMLQNSSLSSFLEKHHLRKLNKLYIFLVYDLFDYGIRYWLMKVKFKCIGMLRK